MRGAEKRLSFFVGLMGLMGLIGLMGPIGIFFLDRSFCRGGGVR